MAPVDDALDRLAGDLRSHADVYTYLDRDKDAAAVRSELQRLREERDAERERFARHIETMIEPKLLARVHAAEAEVRRLRSEVDFYGDRGDFLVYRHEWDALHEKVRRLTEGLREIAGLRSGWENARDSAELDFTSWFWEAIEKADALLASPDGDCEHDYVFVYGFQSTEDFYRCDKCGVRSDDGVYPKVGAFHPHRPDGANTEGGEA